MSNKQSLREQYLAVAGAKTKEVEIPEWGKTVTIQQLDATALIDKKISDGEDREASARDIIASVVDPETSAAVFTNEDIPAILKFQLAGFVRLISAIHEFNGVGKVAEIKKNSKPTRSLRSVGN